VWTDAELIMRINKTVCRFILMVQILIMILLAIPLESVYANERIYFSEIAWAGSSLSVADEWLELANPTNMDIDIGGWRISGAGANETDLVLTYPTIIPANSTLLIANYDLNNQNTALTIKPDVVTSTISLSNTKMLIRLFDANGEIIDQVGDGSAPFAGYSAKTKATMIRISPEIIGTLEIAWRTCDISQNIKTEDCGTPGFIDYFSSQTIIEEPSQETIENIADDTETNTETDVDISIHENTDSELITNDEQSEEEMNNEDTFLSDVDQISNAYLENSSTTTSEDMTNQIIDHDDSALSTSSSMIEKNTAEDTETIMTDTSSTSTNASAFPREQVTTINSDDALTDLLNAKNFLRINEVMAVPVTGKEWVELIILDQSVNINLEEFALYDAVGKIMQLDGMLGGEINYKIIEIPSSRLNNGGDSVSIISTDGTLIDTMEYQSHKKGVSLARDQNMEWQFTQIPTPGQANVIWMPMETKKESADIAKDTDTPKTDNMQTVLTTESTEIYEATENTNNNANQILIKLNEICPNPNEGKEWVELISFADTSVDLTGLELHDSAGRIMKLKGVIDAKAIYVIELSSARLNNGGDKVILINDRGEIMDELEYTGSQKGFSYARMQNGTWKESAIPTKGLFNYENNEENSFDEKTIKEILSTSTTTNIISTSKSSTNTKSTTKTTTKSSTATITKTQSILTLTDYSMLHQEEFGGMRLLLRGTVGTLPRHVSGRGFILLNHDGRGLLVRVPSYKKIPEFGSFIAVTGSLKFDTRELPYLSLTKNDSWNEETSEAVTPSVRKISLLSPTMEDAWSLVQATGTVNSVSGNTVNLIVDNIDVDMTIKPGVEYRASRLKKGDVINVTGILDISNDRATILPRYANEITLIAHAQESLTTTSKQTQGIPGWTPFGAAAIAVGAVEGIKKFKQRFKNQTIKQMMSKQKTL